MNINKISILFILYIFSSFIYGESVKLHTDNFKILKYGGIDSHKFVNKEGSLIIEVNDSANPMIYKFDQAKYLSEIAIKVKIKGKIKLKDKKQGEKKNDDFRFRLGLVFEGDNTISGFQKMFAPEWLKELFKLGEGYRGVDKIQFYTTYQDQSLKDTKRDHYFSEYLKEIHNLFIDEKGIVDQKIYPEKDKKCLGFWIAIDGDDTDSSFTTEIHKIEYKEK